MEKNFFNFKLFFNYKFIKFIFDFISKFLNLNFLSNFKRKIIFFELKFNFFYIKFEKIILINFLNFFFLKILNFYFIIFSLKLKKFIFFFFIKIFFDEKIFKLFNEKFNIIKFKLFFFKIQK